MVPSQSTSPGVPGTSGVLDALVPQGKDGSFAAQIAVGVNRVAESAMEQPVAKLLPAALTRSGVTSLAIARAGLVERKAAESRLVVVFLTQVGDEVFAH